MKTHLQIHICGNASGGEPEGVWVIPWFGTKGSVLPTVHSVSFLDGWL